MTTSSLNYRGALPSQHLLSLINNDFIEGADKANIKPASLDIVITDECYQISGAFQVPRDATVWECMKHFRKTKVSLSEPLQRGKYYIAKVRERMDLPSNVYGYANPKSTTGRIDMHARLLADRVAQNDALTEGFSGDLWVLMKPQSFNTKLYPGDALNQIRLFYSDTRLRKAELEQVMQREGILYDEEGVRLAYKNTQVHNPDSVVLRLDGKPDDEGCIGYQAKTTATVFDYRAKHPKEDFFVPIRPNRNGMVFLKKDTFNILSSAESVSVPLWLACEMVSIDDRFGEFRSHYAGFIDPGWGAHPVQGRPLTLEVRPFENIYVQHGQPIARIKFEHLSEMPDIAYDAIPSNYLIQTKAKLAKQFY